MMPFNPRYATDIMIMIIVTASNNIRPIK